MGFSQTRGTLMSVVLHASLHVSSFEFLLPQRRNFKYNIIFPEMRLHTMIFAYRALICMIIAVYFPYFRILNGFVVLLTMAAADAVTRYYKDSNNGTMMRGNAYPDGWPITFMNRFYSASQIMATLNMTFTKPEGMFLTVLPIQIAPFLMTLEKKGIISQQGWHGYYIASLFVSYYWGGRWGLLENGVTNLMYWPLVGLLYLGRIHFGVNKYILWSAPILINLCTKIG